jgi:hypothetical protein
MNDRFWLLDGYNMHVGMGHTRCRPVAYWGPTVLKSNARFSKVTFQYTGDLFQQLASKLENLFA